MIDLKDLTQGFKELNLRKGDIVLVHSSFKSFGGVVGGPQTVIDALLNVIGREGTLVMPTFTFAFCDQYNNTGRGYFDVDKTPSEMGILTEIVRKMAGAKRSINPIYSVAIFGRFRDELVKVEDKSIFGEHSIFGKLHRHDAKIMIIGLSYNRSLTFFHYIEQMESCDYRHLKDFSGIIVANGKKFKDTFTMNVRNNNVVTAVDPMGEMLEKRGLVRIKKIGRSIVKLLRIKEIYEVTAREIKKNPRLLYRNINDSK